ncbi:MAG: hypothetical protein GX558_01650, partial [Clostridiales bacterium]|nr:hypothetical protein [Clostridiales bacterium]
MRWSLGKCEWKLMGHWPHAPAFGRSMETGLELKGVTDWIPARVPGSVQADLLAAGLIDDPYYEKNSLKCEWAEHRWWHYRTSFDRPAAERPERATLVFQGVDYAARFFLNGQFLGRHEGMYEPAAFDVTALLRDACNRLDVIVEDAPRENGQLGHTSDTITQKARFGYKWDFGTRLVNLGIWEDVVLDLTGPYALADVHVTSDWRDGKGMVRLRAAVDGYRGQRDVLARVALSGHGVELAADAALSPTIDHTFVIDDPALWQVNGLGDQPLYAVSIEVADGLGESDRWRGAVGVRSLTYRRAEGADRHALPYSIVVNGRQVYLRGVNITPLDHMYGSLTRRDYLHVLNSARQLGVNLIRVWGGGVIEKEHFYQLCDEYGILVWQEFIQSSSGVDNIPSKRPEFLKLLEKAAVAALKARRSHTCLAVWSGGNELMDAQGRPANDGDENLKMLADLCRRCDPDRLFLPTSASGPSEWLLPDQPGRNHDVHGNWQYEGVRNHYDRFNRSDSMLHSEFGAEAMSSMASLRRILSPERLARPVSMAEDLTWRHHGEWWDVFGRDSGLFGPLTDLPRWTLLSQFIQAEGLRYALEANRRRKYRNVGSIIWQLNEPWPNASCTCLLEHRGHPKMAYYWVKKAYAPIALSMRYDSLIAPAGAPAAWALYVHNAHGDARYTARARVYDLQGQL